jgi:sec-independent protein translocase protein TatC
VHDPFDDSLFEGTKMSFGEHLDELRQALIKAMLALAIGFGIALWPPISGAVIEYVQTPLKDALKEYYRGVAEREYRQILEQQRQAGMPVPKDIDAAAAMIAKEGLVPEERFVDPQEMAEALESVLPGAVDKSKLPAGEVGDVNVPDTTGPPDETGEAATANRTLRDRVVPWVMYHKLEADPRLRVVGLSVQEPFSVYIKAAFVVGAVIASPFVFYYLWNFVAVGLYPHEKRYIHVFLPMSLGLFLAGVGLAFFFVFQFVLAFLFQFYEWMGIDPDPRITDWLSFVLILPLGFGISFQLPLVMLFLERIGVFSVASYLGQWRMAVLVIFILAMVLTPSDPYSMLLMAVPLVILYFGGVALCQYLPRRKVAEEYPSD